MKVEIIGSTDCNWAVANCPIANAVYSQLEMCGRLNLTYKYPTTNLLTHLLREVCLSLLSALAWWFDMLLRPLLYQYF